MVVSTAPKCYKYLRVQSGRNPAECLDSDIASFGCPPGSLPFVVRDEGVDKRRAGFYAFATPEDFWAWHDKVPEKHRAFHEVVFGHAPQRLKFDLDMKLDDLMAVPAAVFERLAAQSNIRDPEAAERELDELMGGAVYHPPPLSTADPQTRARLALEHVLLTAADVFYDSYPGAVGLCLGNFNVASSCGSHKFSYHAVAPHAVANALEARNFASVVAGRVEPELRMFVDLQVYSMTQNFRLLGSSKGGRVKRPDADLAHSLGVLEPTRASAVIRAPPNSPVLPCVQPRTSLDVQMGDKASADDPAVTDAVRAMKEAGCLGAHVFRAARHVGDGTLVEFRRTRPSMCELCNRLHNTDNTMLARRNDDGSVIELCRRAPGRGVLRRAAHVPFAARPVADPSEPQDARPDTPDLTAAGPAPPGTPGWLQRAMDPGTHARWLDPDALAADRGVTRTLYDEPYMRPLELHPTLAVRAQMKCGKTRAVRQFIDRNFPTGTVPPVIRFVTFRQTFADSLRVAFSDFLLYSDHPGVLSAEAHPRMIVQVESLHRLATSGEPEPDLVILDEVESILAQFSSGLHKRLTQSFAVFQWLMARSRHVVCMDANIGDRSLRMLRRLRLEPGTPAVRAAGVHLHWNQFLRAATDTYQFTASRDALLADLLRELGAGRRAVVASNSLTEAESVARVVRDRFPQLKVGVYSSRTAPATRALHFADVARYWAELDVLVYTPTVTAGISFELQHFDVLYGFFTDRSCDVETTRQMIGRVRSITEFRVCLQVRPARLPVRPEEIAAMLRDERRHLLSAGCQDQDAPVEFDPASGEIRAHKSPYYYLWLENRRMENLSRNAFGPRFVAQTAASGARCEWLENAVPEDCAAAKKLRTAACAAFKLGKAQEVAEARELAPDEAEEIATRVADGAKSNNPVTDREMNALRKSRLRAAFQWEGALPVALVQDLLHVHARRAFRTLDMFAKEVRTGPAWTRQCVWAATDWALRQLARREAMQHIAALEDVPGDLAPDNREIVDLNRRYVFTMHANAVWLLRVCGFGGPLDPRAVSWAQVQLGLHRAHLDIGARAGKIAAATDTRRPLARSLTEPGRVFCTAALRFVNDVASALYGVRVARVGDRCWLARTAAGAGFEITAPLPPGVEPGDLEQQLFGPLTLERPAVHWPVTVPAVPWGQAFLEEVAGPQGDDALQVALREEWATATLSPEPWAPRPRPAQK